MEKKEKAVSPASPQEEKPKVEGYLKKKSPKKALLAHLWQNRYFQLFEKSGKLMYFKSHKDAESGQQPKGIIPIDRIKEIHVLKLRGDRRFDLDIEGGRIFSLQTDSKEETERWTIAIGTCQKGHVKPLGKEEVGAKFWKPEQHEKSDLSIYLAETPFQFRLNPAQVRAFASFFNQQHYKEGVPLFQENSPVSQVLYYVVVSGEVGLFVRGAAGDGCTREDDDEAEEARETSVGARPALSPKENAAKDGGAVKADGAAVKDNSSSPAAAGKDGGGWKESVVEGSFSGLNSPRDWDKLSEPLDGHGTEESAVQRMASKTVSGRTSAKLARIPSFSQNKIRGKKAKWHMLENAKRICTVTSGYTLGGATIMDGVRIASAVPLTDIVCLELTKSSLEVYFNDYPECKHIVVPLMGFNPTAQLSKIDMFRGIPAKKLALVGSLLRYVALNKGDILFEEGSVGGSMFIVAQGTVVALARDGEAEKLLHTFEAGDVFGEISLLMDIPRTASIIANAEALLLELRKEDFANFASLIPEQQRQNLDATLKKQTSEHFRKYKVPFFESIPDDKYSILAQLCTIKTVAADTVLFKEGDIGNTFYIIAHGECKVTVFKEGADHEIEVCRMGPGKYFGEIALVQDTPRTATVTTVTRCVILSITKENFQKFFHEAPEAIADFEIKLARYGVSLRAVIYHHVGLKFFEEHLKLEYSSENIDFWKAVHDYRLMLDPRYDESITHTDEEMRRDTKLEMSAQQRAQEEQRRQKRASFGGLLDPVKDFDTLLDAIQASFWAFTESDPETGEIEWPLVFREEELVGGSSGMPVGNGPLAVPTGNGNSNGNGNGNGHLRVSFESSDLERVQKPRDYVTIPQLKTGVEMLTGKRGQDISGLLSMVKGSTGAPSTLSFEQYVEAMTSCDMSTPVLGEMKAVISGEGFRASRGFKKATQGASLNLFVWSEMIQNTLQKKFTRKDITQLLWGIEVDATTNPNLSMDHTLKFVFVERRNRLGYTRHLNKVAKKIYDTFIVESAPTQVNIMGPTTDYIKECMAKGIATIHTFEAAEEEIFNLMASDSFARFKQGALFQEFLGTSHSYTEVEKKGHAGGRNRGASVAVRINPDAGNRLRKISNVTSPKRSASLNSAKDELTLSTAPAKGAGDSMVLSDIPDESLEGIEGIEGVAPALIRVTSRRTGTPGAPNTPRAPGTPRSPGTPGVGSPRPRTASTIN